MDATASEIRRSSQITNTTYRLERRQISGMVTLQRKSMFVARFAEIKDCIFSYKKK